MSLSAVSERSQQQLSSEEESDEEEQEIGVATARPPEPGGAVHTIAATDVLDLLDQVSCSISIYTYIHIHTLYSYKELHVVHETFCLPLL